MSSAQAAASAAFLGTKAPDMVGIHKRKPSFRINTNLAPAQQKTASPRPPVSAENLTQHLQFSPEPPMSTTSGRRNSRSGMKSSTRTTPSSGPSSGAGANLRPGTIARSSSSKYTPGSGATKPAQWSLKTPLAVAETPAANLDYFSLPRLGSVSSQDLLSHTPRAKSPQSMKPQDMLDQVRQLINSKSKSGTSKEAVRKSQLAINEFRKSVDLRRLLSQAASLNGALCDELYKETSSAPSSRQNSAGELYDIPAANRSQSSVGSIVSDTNSNLGNPTSANQNNNGVQVDEPLPPLNAPNFRLSYCDTATSDILKKPLSTSHEAPSPIPIPLLSMGVDRGLAVTPSDSMAKLSISPANLASTSGEVVGEHNEVPTKPGRKKPPTLSYDTDSLRETSGLDMESCGVGAESSDIDTDESEGVKFPLFPGISGKLYRKGLFSKKKKQRDTGVVYDPEPAEPEEQDHQIAPVRSHSTTKNLGVPVKLRTTMRKEDKRKEKKTAFNEDKPWKNHGDLDVISDAQRKRYEGLWVSNKGLYLNHVVTKLVGVDYEREVEEEEPVLAKSVREYSEKEISERAAKLSASLNVDFDLTDVKELHSLESATTQNLIHGSVVKELWSRSNLPRETLHAIWHLVDCRNDGTLNKAEFIVGMWLVDQCLYGRKLPKVVNKLVWSSLGGLGVNVVIKKKRR